MQTSPEWTYVAGLWKETLPQGLCWTVQGTNLAQPQQKYVAPSWSWASVDGAVEYVGPFNAEFTDKIINWEAKLVDFNIEIQGKNDLGTVKEDSYLMLHGPMVPCTLEVPGMMVGAGAKCCQLSPVGKSS